MEEVSISQTTGGVGLRLCDPERGADGSLEYFTVQIVAPTIRAQTRVYAFHSKGLPTLFEEIAESWRGWAGAKEWSSLEGEFKLSCTTDGKGHVHIATRLADSLYGDLWRLEATVLLEAGQLEGIAKSVLTFVAGEQNAA